MSLAEIKEINKKFLKKKGELEKLSRFDEIDMLADRTVSVLKKFYKKDIERAAQEHVSPGLDLIMDSVGTRIDDLAFYEISSEEVKTKGKGEQHPRTTPLVNLPVLVSKYVKLPKDLEEVLTLYIIDQDIDDYLQLAEHFKDAPPALSKSHLRLYR